MKKLIMLMDVCEIATGVGLFVAPSLVGELLLGQQLVGTAVMVARVAGIALIALGIACWPGPPAAGMLAYSAGTTLYLGFLGGTGLASGTLLWPAVILHAILTMLLLRAFAQSRKPAG